MSLAWFVPLLALALVFGLGYRAWSMRGLIVTVQLDDGHGLKPGDEVRFRGIAVGQVRDVELLPDLETVVVTLSVNSQAARIARAGSRFWVVRPELGLDRIAGLETIVGPRYMAVLPGEGERQDRFVGLSAPPPVDRIDPGDLEVVIEAPQRSGLRVGGPVLYRQIRVGTILSVGLASDAGSVEARIHVTRPYAQLIRPQTRFWPVHGVRTEVGLTGFSMELESIETLLAGGVALATPPDAGAPVRTGHRFELEDEPEASWLQWQPMVAVGSGQLPGGTILPSPLRATIGWRDGWIIFKGDRSRRGWVVQTSSGLLGPRDLLEADPEADEGSSLLEVAGRSVPLPATSRWSDGRLTLLEQRVSDRVWPASRIRSPGDPEDCVAVADLGAGPLPLSASRLRVEDGVWRVDAAMTVDRSWHGACVVARGDGMLVGLLLIEEADRVSIALLPSPEELQTEEAKSD
jgi:hypothetical protein